MPITLTECACCGNRDNTRFIQKSDGYICKTCGCWFRYETEEEKAGCMDGRRRLKNYRFEDAREAFAEVLDKYPDSIDALWGSLLSRYGIVFVTGFFDGTAEPIYCFPEYDEYGEKRFCDERAYKKILRLLEERDEDMRLSDFYESKGKEIDRAIKKYSESKKSTDVDVFICVKISAATEENPTKSGRTVDYEYALKVYNDLKKKGVNAFFSFVTLKNNVESDDLIWVNLVKSKKMLIIGSAEEYLDSTWVKSEWKRWLYLNREKDLYICSMKHDNEYPKAILPHELAALHPQVYTLDTYEKMINELCEGLAAGSGEKEKPAPVPAQPAAPAPKQDGKIVYTDSKTEVLKYGLKTIAKQAYCDNTEIISVELPSSVTKIGFAAFLDCSSLSSITIPEGVTTIDDCAFNFCKRLKSLTLPESLTHLGKCLQECQSLSTIKLSSNITKILNGTFTNSGLRNITIPEGVTEIEDYAFSDCKSLTTVYIPKSMQKIGYSAFNCISESGNSYKDVTPLREVRYAGSKADWKKIDIAGGNEKLNGPVFRLEVDGPVFPRAKIRFNCKEEG